MDLAIVNVNFVGSGPEAEALGVEGGEIAVVGSEQQVLDESDSETEVIDGNGGTMIPGFNDAHTHFASMGVSMSEYLDLTGMTSKEQLLDAVKKEAEEKSRGDWIVGIGWDESNWSGDREFMEKEEIDRVASDNPVTLRRVDGHLSCLNSVALKELDFDPEMEGYETEEGEPTGRIMEEARYVIREEIEPAVEAIERGIKEAARKAAELGVTSVHDMHVNRKKFKAYQNLWNSGELPIRARLYFDRGLLDDIIDLGLTTGFGDDTLSLGGLKVFTDGSIGAKTAWVTEGYLNEPENLGTPIWSGEELKETMARAHENDLQIAAHAIGDRAVTEVLDIMESINSGDYKGLRHRLEHGEMMSRSNLKRLKALGMVASMQPNFIGEWGLPGGMYDDRFPKKQVEKLNPLRWIQEEEVPMAFGSDCMPFDPLYGVDSAVNTPYRAQKLTPEEAIAAYTNGSAYPEFMETKKGLIAEGALADLVLLGGKPEERQEEIKSLEVKLTLLGGEVVFRK
jgi:hypothetical protein